MERTMLSIVRLNVHVAPVGEWFAERESRGRQRQKTIFQHILKESETCGRTDEWTNLTVCRWLGVRKDEGSHRRREQRG